MKKRVISRIEAAALELERAIGTNKDSKSVRELKEKTRMKEIALQLNKTLEAFLDKMWLADGQYLNIDRSTWQLKIPVPWSSKNYKEYGLTRTTADILKRIVQRRGDDFFLVYIDGEKRYYVANGYERMYCCYKYLIDKPITEEEVKDQSK